MAIEDWLLTHAAVAQAKDQATKPSLLLIGASAGWMMSNVWLQQFSRVDTFDIDPFAATLFKWRHGAGLQSKGVTLHCHTQDALTDLPSLLKAHPTACVFFDNVLGQLRFQSPATDWQQVEQKIARIRQQLKGREWGSLHDRMSGTLTESIALHDEFPVRKPEWSDQQWLTHLKAQSPWLDHLTHSVFPAMQTPAGLHNIALQDFAWTFSPRYRHWLQAGWVRP
jgi:hypothetical protein